MKNFKLIRRDVEIGPLLEEIRGNSDMWDADPTRTSLAPHRETRTIILRSHTEPASTDKAYRERFPGCWTYVGRPTTVAHKFPLACAFVEGFARSVAGVLGRVALVSLQPHGTVYPHIDEGNYYRVRSRYHLVLQSAAGSRLNTGGQGITMHEGELWWFNNRIMHDAHNNSDQERIHIIIDLASPESVASAGYRFSRNRAADLYRAIRRRVA